MYFTVDRYLDKKKHVTKVPTIPPKNPSQVFLGDNLIKGVLPNKTPKKYAIASLKAIAITSRMNQK